VETRRELIEAVAARYRAAKRDEKKGILDEFVKVAGLHRKHAIRVLKRSPRPTTDEPRQRTRIYNEAVREALTIVWEAADRICGKRLRQVIGGLIDAMERHGHLKLDPAVREGLLSMSAATMDRLLKTVATPPNRASPNNDQYTVAKEYRHPDLWRLERSLAGLFRNGHGGALW
jgi:hypothetical protein